VSPTDKAALLIALGQGQEFDYLPFWGPELRAGCLSPGVFCQWYEAPFVLDEVRYPTCEHYMMAQKAYLFGDMVVQRQILATRQPAQAKLLGRQVRGFDEARWRGEREAVVWRANLAKFSQHPALGDYLIGSGAAVLVEASPHDRVWGCGLAADHPNIRNPFAWPGLNLLGFGLMRVRAALCTARA